MNKKVLMVSVLDVKGSTNIPQALAFIRRGYNIIPINYRTVIQKYGMEFFNNLVLNVCNQEKPHLTLFTKCNGVHPELVKRCSDISTTWLWNPDPIQTIERCPEVIEHAKNATHSSCTSQTVVDYFKSKGVENCYQILDGLDTEMFKPVDVDEKY